RLMGEYLAWFYDTLLADAPSNLQVERHYAAATDISQEIGGRETILLDNARSISVDHVVLTSGHTFNNEPVAASTDVRYWRPVPGELLHRPVPPGGRVPLG